MEVEFDAGIRREFRRAGRAETPRLDGDWRCAELATQWTIRGDEIHAFGPVRSSGAAWRIEALTPNNLRVHIPSALYPTWADAVLSVDGRKLTINAGRARGLVFERA